MRRKKKMILALGAAFLISGVSVSALQEVSVLLQASSSKVEVHLEEFMMKNGEEVFWEDGQTVLPGGVLSKIPRIFNEGEPCYVRAAVEFENREGRGSPLTVKQLVGIDQDWICRGNYFYYQRVLPSEESVDFFQGIQIPGEWESGVDDGQSWDAAVKVDAVQAEHFQPDFSGEDPWGLEKESFEIQKAVKEVPKEEGETDPKPISFSIEPQMKGFSVDAGEAFRNLSPFVPGETQTGTLEFSNQTSQEREVYMCSEIIEENEFLKELELTVQVRMGNQVRVIYRGNMLAEELQEYRSLGKIPAKAGAMVEIFVTLPKEADNRYSVQTGKVKFRFTTDLPENRTAAGIVKTGDRYSRQVLLEILFALASLGLCMYLYFRKYRKGGRK
ncbi:MAG: hypothetical protein KH828_02335 [Clostridiales bacterium]|nr:hypothetical protein [Clostridiales bacterium]